MSVRAGREQARHGWARLHLPGSGDTHQVFYRSSPRRPYCRAGTRAGRVELALSAAWSEPSHRCLSIMMTLTSPWKRRPSSWCGAAHLARASVHAGCPQSGTWPHHGTTSAVEHEPQTKIRSLALPGSLAGVLVALEGRRAGRVGRVVYLAVLPGARRLGPPGRRLTSPLARGPGHGASGPLPSRGGLAMSGLPELARPRFPG
jgi:hypothetical protein